MLKKDLGWNFLSPKTGQIGIVHLTIDEAEIVFLQKFCQ